MTIFGRFRAWGSVLCSPAKPTAYRWQNINFERRFGNLNNFPTVKLNGRPLVQQVTIFWRFGTWGSVLCPPAKPTTYPLQNINFERRFGNIKNFPTVKLNGRSPGQEVNIFGSFRAWGSVLYPPAKPTAYRLQNINFERRFGNIKNFPKVKFNRRSPGQEIRFLYVSETEEAYYALRQSQRLTFRKITIWATFRQLKKFS